MHRAGVLAVLVTALLFSGCVSSAGTSDETSGIVTSVSDPAGPAQPDDAKLTPEHMTVSGVVVDQALSPLVNATVHILELNQTVKVGAGGTFRLEGLVPSTYILTAAAPEYEAQTLSVDPKTAANPMRFVLAPLPTNLATNETFAFHGHLQCALEAVIITPSCDTIITADPVNHAPVLNDTFSMQVPVGPNWKTVVADIVFDPAQQPGMAGLRVTARGTYDPHQLGTYADYGKFNGTHSFTFRLAPDGAYPGGTKPVPSNTTQFEFDTYPLSYGWHTVCEPGSENCFLGVGAGLDVDFEVYATVFYVEPAPEGWTLQT